MMTLKIFCESFYADLDCLQNLDEQLQVNNILVIELKNQLQNEDLYPSIGVAKYTGVESSNGSGANQSPVEAAAEKHYHNMKSIEKELQRVNDLILLILKEKAEIIKRTSPVKIALSRLNEVDNKIICLKYGGCRTGKRVTNEAIAEAVDLTDKTVLEHLRRLGNELPEMANEIMVKSKML